MEPRTHEPTDDPMWQESNECHAYDPVAGLGFVTASGAFARRGSGLAYVGAYLTTPDGARVCFQRTDNDVPLTPGDRGPLRNGASFLHWTWLAEGVGHLTVDAPGCTIDVTFEDVYPEAHWTEEPVPGATGHVEASGSVRGHLLIHGCRVDVDALAHRDQSWGPRDLAPLRSHAWFAGTCGPELSFTSENLVVAAGPDAIAVRSGFVATPAGIDTVVVPDLAYAFAWDLFTPTAVMGSLRTASGAVYELTTADPSPTFLNVRTLPDGSGVVTATDTLFTVRCGDRRGIACLNLVPSVTGGREAAAVLAGTPTDQGVWRP